MGKQEGETVETVKKTEPRVRRMRRNKLMVQRMMKDGRKGKGNCKII